MTPEEYLENHTSPCEQYHNAIERWAHLNTPQPQMLCGPYEGRLLSMLCHMAHARCAVEIGTFVGYSSTFIAEGLSDGGILHTFEVNDEKEQIIQQHLEMAGVSEKVELHIGDAMELLPRLIPEDEKTIDFAFIDADKRHTADYYELLLKRMHSGSILVVDNVLWNNKVLSLEKNSDFDTQYMHRFNETVQQDERVENIMLNVRDGLLVCLVK